MLQVVEAWQGGERVTSASVIKGQTFAWKMGKQVMNRPHSVGSLIDPPVTAAHSAEKCK